MSMSPPSGTTPPAPGLEREEPELVREEDIPSDDGAVEALLEEAEHEERPLREVERE